MAPVSAWLPNSRPQHPLHGGGGGGGGGRCRSKRGNDQTSLAVTGLGPCYCHQLHLHLTVAHQGIRIGFLTRFPTTAPTSHFLDGLALHRLLPHTFTVGSRFGVYGHTPSEVHALAFATAHILGGLALRRAPAPPLLHLCSCMLWLLLPHSFPVGSHSDVCCHTHSRRSRALVCTHTSTVYLSGRILPCLLPHTLPAGSHSGVCCHTHSRRSRAPARTHTSAALSWQACAPVFTATHNLDDLTLRRAPTPSLLRLLQCALWCLLPHTYAAGLRFSICCHTPSQAHAPMFAATHILGSLVLQCVPAPPLLRFGSCTL